MRPGDGFWRVEAAPPVRACGDVGAASGSWHSTWPYLESYNSPFFNHHWEACSAHIHLPLACLHSLPLSPPNS